MNALQLFLAGANVQTRTVIQEALVLSEDPSGTYAGTFGDPQIMNVMTRQGYQDHLVTPLKVERVMFADWTPQEIDALARKTLVRTQTGRTFFINIVDYTEAVVFTFILTDREL